MVARLHPNARVGALCTANRRRILKVLSEQALSLAGVAKACDVSHPSASIQLGILRRAGLVRAERRGPRDVVYHVLPDELRNATDALLAEIRGTAVEPF